MNVKEFSEKWKVVLDSQAQAFERNFKSKEYDWVDWIQIWVAWSELSSDEEIEYNYGWMEEE